MVSKVPELIDEKTDVMYENIAEIVNDTAETLSTRIEESTNKHSEAMKEVASKNDLTMVDGKIRFL